MVAHHHKLSILKVDNDWDKRRSGNYLLLSQIVDKTEKTGTFYIQNQENRESVNFARKYRIGFIRTANVLSIVDQRAITALTSSMKGITYDEAHQCYSIILPWRVFLQELSKSYGIFRYTKTDGYDVMRRLYNYYDGDLSVKSSTVMLFLEDISKISRIKLRQMGDPSFVNEMLSVFQYFFLGVAVRVHADFIKTGYNKLKLGSLVPIDVLSNTRGEAAA